MNKVKIISDSTCDLTKEIVEKYDIEIVPLFVTFKEESYRDGVDITTPDVYKKVKEYNELPKTAAITIDALMEVFKKYIDLGYDVVFTGISRAMSRTYENAVLAAKEIDENRIFVVDSKNLSTGIAHIVLKACEYRDKGDSASVIAAKMERDRELVYSQFSIERMDYLHKGGRCTGIARFLGTLLKIKPIIVVRDGKMSVGKKPIGKMKISLDAQINMILADKDRLDKSRIFVTHSIAPESEEYMVKRLKELFPDVEIIVTVAGCVISSHCGPGTIGVLYMVKEENN